MPFMLPPLRHIPPHLYARVPTALNFLTVHSGLIICALFLLAGLVLAGDYGIDRDGPIQRRNAQDNLKYILGQTDRLVTGYYHDRVYGMAFELPLLLTERALGLTDRPSVYRLRFTLTHLLFIVGGYFCYRLAYRLFNNRLLALCALLFYLLHPRIYGNSFINSKDLPFLSMFSIALYLLERAFRRDTHAAFVLLGIAVGLLTNLRIMGIMLFAAALGMRGLDLFYAGSGSERKRTLLTAGLFALAAGLTLYAVTPYAWTHPWDYLTASLNLTVNHPHVEWNLFQGEDILPSEAPAHYNLVWFGITTPPLLLLLSGVGIVAVLAQGLARPGAVFRNNRRRLQGLLLACFLLPPLAAALLSSSQYYDWRHFYFLSVPFGLLAAGGLRWLSSNRAGRLFRAGVYGLAGAGLGLIALSMAQIHPLQDIYFNFLVDRTTPEYLRTQYRVRSPNASEKRAVEYLRQRHPGETLAVRGVWGDEPGFREGFVEGDYALFYILQGQDPDLAFNALPVGRAYNNTLLAVKPLQSSRMSAAARETYRELYRQAVAGTPIIRDAFAVYRRGQTLTFIRENCPPGDMERRVFVKVLKADPGREKRPSILLRSHGVRWDDTCLALVRLPDAAWVDLILGQDWPGGYQWQQLYSRAQPGLRERIAAARRDNPRPAGREGFAVFREQNAAGQNRLLYAKGECTPEEYSAPIGLHIYPENLTDMPFYRWEVGFENRDFRLRDYGGRPGGECLAAFLLPDYPGGIKEIRTGQAEGWNEVIYFPVDPTPLRADYAALAAAEPVVRDYFDLYERDNRLLYLRESCAAMDTTNPFFLHIIPQQAADLPIDRRDAGFAHLGFDFARQGGPFDGKCLAAVALPDYPIKEMRTGQHIPGPNAPLWSVRLIAAPDFDQLRADYAAVSAANPAARSNFDLYWQDNRLLYLRETCAAADTAANFFLHIVPADAVDLPADRREAGFAHSGFEFVRQGGHFDGKCLAAVALPDYPIKEMRTGQHIPGQGDLWSALIAAP